MANITDLYMILFGKGAIQDGDVISMAEHGRIGNVSTGAGYKRVGIFDSSGNQIDTFGGGTQYTQGNVVPPLPTGNTIMYDNLGFWQAIGASNPLPVTGTFSPPALQNVNLTQVAGVSYVLGQANATLSAPVVLPQSQITALTPLAPFATITALQGNAPWLMTMATLSVIANQSGIWSISSLPTLSVYQGGTWNIFATISNIVTAKGATSPNFMATMVSGGTTSAVLLSSNTSRLGATFYNNSANILYLLLGTMASISRFTAKLYQEDYYEVPYNYIGEIDGLWDGKTGSVSITELT